MCNTYTNGLVAQWLERWSYEPNVVSSTLTQTKLVDNSIYKYVLFTNMLS